MVFDDYVAAIKSGTSLERSEAALFLAPMLDDQDLPEAAIAEALTALTEKGVSVEEICGFIDAMRARMTTIEAPAGAIDTCGTGGDKSGTFNVSTTAAVVLAAAGVPVAKHGNRAATSKCGSADVLEALGIPVDLQPKAAETALNDHNFVFLFAQQYHPSLKRLAIVRKSLGFPTVFNLLGPLLNPAQVKHQVIGTPNALAAQTVADVAVQMNYDCALILTSSEGLDEAGLNGLTSVYEVRGTQQRKLEIIAADFDLAPAAMNELQGGDAEGNAAIVQATLEPADKLDARQRIVAFNAGLALYAAGEAQSIAEGVAQAKSLLASDAPSKKLQELRQA